MIRNVLNELNDIRTKATNAKSIHNPNFNLAIKYLMILEVIRLVS